MKKVYTYRVDRIVKKRWCGLKYKWCEYAQSNGHCAITACIKAGESE